MTCILSIIVPVFNTSMYLDRCLNSLVNQTLTNYEIIAVNDASTDNSLEILLEFQKKHQSFFKVINLKQNIKQGGAKNRGIEQAKGKYIAFVDSDDWIDETMFEKMISIAEKNNSDVVDCDYYETDGNYKKKIISLNSDFKQDEVNLKRQFILSSGRMVTKIYRKTLFTENNLVFTENVFYEDNELAPLLLYYAKKVTKLNDFLYFYYVKNESTTRSKNNFSFFDRLTTAKNFLTKFESLSDYYLYKNEVEYVFIKLYFVNTAFGVVNMFNPLPYNELKIVFEEVKTNFSNYCSNKYFKQHIPLLKKIFLRLGIVNFNLFFYLFKFYKIIIK